MTSQGSQGLHLLGFTPQRLLGSGNTSVVYLALDAKGKRVAIKLPFDQTLADPARADRFANEVRLSLQLKHEKLVVGYEGVPFGEGAYLSMRYFPEGTLARWMDLGKLGLPESLRILADVAEALCFLHGRGVVHQDVKPQNVYLDDGRAALGDFGAAYFVTQGGPTAGSPFYMAPEVYRGEGTTTASDIYSLGVLAYEMLTDTRPFNGDSYDALMAAHLSSYPRPLTNLVPDLPRSTAMLIEKAFSKNAADRPHAQDLKRAFEKALGVESAEPEAAVTPEKPAARAPLGRHTTPPSAPARPQESAAKPAPTPATDEPAKGGFWNALRRRTSR
ncbi:serine/threonine-protein kinase [Deinococcus pimensis]|uniref:serine/threonine-protein kinase n=1 Tax=Deinococcus pimensis TaxID=309888 RepID=UPI00047F7027|nr:serine/threonine-protein kinase [Deinococcus pimensis]